MCYLERPDRKWRRIQPYRSSSLFFARWSTIAQPAPTMSAAIINFTKSPGRNGYIPLANNSPPAARRRGRWPQLARGNRCAVSEVTVAVGTGVPRAGDGVSELQLNAAMSERSVTTAGIAPTGLSILTLSLSE